MVDKGTDLDNSELAQKPDSSRWCWECRRRRLVCDCTRPICNKCKATGVVCPGYEDKKPLTWLAPGRVLSRTRKPRGRPANQRSVAKKANDDTPSTAESAMSPSKDVALRWRAAPPLHLAQPRPEMCDLAEAAMYCKTGPLQLPLLSLWAHTKHEAFFRLTKGISSDNTAVYPDLSANQLAPNPFVVPVLELYDIPSSMQHALVAMALCHRIYRSPGPVELKLDLSSEPVRKAWWTRLHHHRGLAIRLMNEDIGKEDTRASNETITTVLVFLVGELQQSLALSHAWRYHVNGLMALFKLRGGFDKLISTTETLKPSMLAFLLIVVTSNTTSPSDDQVAVTSFTHVPGLISDLYGLGIYPPFPCAQDLFLDIGNIDHLRARAAASHFEEDFESQVLEAHDLLEHVAAFNPEEWAARQSSEFRDEWVLAARIYHAAVTLYCISSLQSLELLPSTPQLQTRRAAQRDRLMWLLAEGLASPLLKKSVLWPLIVAGFEACEGGSVERRFVARHLEEQSRDLGTSQPLVAKSVFERFWRSGKTKWDDCFDRPYAFLG